MGTPSPHQPIDSHDLLRDSVSIEGPYRLCPGLGHSHGLALTPTSPHPSYEQLLAAEPLRIRTRPTPDETLSLPPAAVPTSFDKPASLDAVYELLSDGIFTQRSYDDDVDLPAKPQPKPITRSSATKKRRAPKLQTFVGGASGSTHNVAVARRIRSGQQRLRRCVERSQSALLENLRSVQRRECDDCGTLHSQQHPQSNHYLNGPHSRCLMECSSDNHDLAQATQLKSKARDLLSAYENELRTASSRFTSPTPGSKAPSAPITQTVASDHGLSTSCSASANLRHSSKENISDPTSLDQLSSKSRNIVSSLIPLTHLDHPEEARSFLSAQDCGRGKILERASRGHEPQASAADAIVHDIAECILDPESPDDTAGPATPTSSSQQDSNECVKEPIKSEQLRCESLRRIRESLQTAISHHRMLEKQSLKSLHDVQELMHANLTVVARLRHDAALTAKKRHTLQQAKAKINMARNTVVHLTAKIFLLRLNHDASLARQRLLFIDRLTSRWPTITLRLILRTWASNASQYCAPLRPLLQHSSHLAEQVQARQRRHFLLIWLLRTRHLTLCQRLMDAAVKISSASPFFRWRMLTLRCQRLRASIEGKPLPWSSPFFSDMLKAYRLRCRAQVSQLIGANNVAYSPALSSMSDTADDRMVELAATLHDRRLRRTAYSRWTCAFHQLRRQQHLDMLGEWHLVRRTLLRWRHRVSQVRDFVINSDERRIEYLQSSAFRHWALMADQRRRACEVIRTTVYPHRLLKRTMIRWRRRASILRAHAALYGAVLNQKRRRYIHDWKRRLSARQRFRNVLDRIETLHLQLQFHRQWTRWRDRIRHMRLVRRVFRDAISRWTARLQTSKVSPVKAFSAWLRFVDSQRLKRIRRVQASTAALYDGIRIRIWALRRWRHAYQRVVLFRSWKTATKQRARKRHRFLLKWRYLVPISMAFKALRANVSVAKKAEALVWKAHYL